MGRVSTMLSSVKVVDAGGFSSAARQLNRSASVVTTARIVMRTLAIVIALLAATAAARAAELNAFVSTAIKSVTDELLPPFERTR